METILLVDDEPHVLTLVREVLELGGYNVLGAGSAEEAFRLEAAHAGPIDLLLTDIMMPGLTGPEMARRIVPRRPEMKLLYMSAFTLVDMDNQRICLEPGVPILTKPFSVDALIGKVRSLLHRSPSPDSRVPSEPARVRVPEAKR